jgi:hypothetical protein
VLGLFAKMALKNKPYLVAKTEALLKCYDKQSAGVTAKFLGLINVLTL